MLCGPSRDDELLSNTEILMSPRGLMAPLNVPINRHFLMPLAALDISSFVDMLSVVWIIQKVNSGNFI